MIGVEALGGYVLEEVVARMLQDDGYRLLSDAADDPSALVSKGQSLFVRGRGSDHQADALGDLATPIPFGLPVRLFVEAKHHTRKVDLPVLRNAHGVIHDVNQCYATPRTGARPTQRYDYRYAVFSTSGFTAEADDFAQAHQISLHDLSGDSAVPLRSLVTSTAQRLRDLARAARLTSFPLHAVRLALRACLGTLEAPAPRAGAAAGRAAAGAADAAHRLREASARFPALEALDSQLGLDAISAAVSDVTSAAGSWTFLVGYPDGPSVLALRPDSLDDFVEHYRSQREAPIDVDIHYAPARRSGHGEFVITPHDTTRGGFRLRFGAPDIVVRDVLTTPEPAAGRRLEPELGTITVFHDQRAVQLSYVPRQVPPGAAADARAAADWLRAAARSTAEPAARAVELDDEVLDAPEGDDGEGAFDGADGVAGAWVEWTPAESRDLRARLRASDRGSLLEALVSGPKRGLGRGDVLEAVGRDAGRSLYGVLSPTAARVRAMHRDGLAAEKHCPVRPRKSRGRVTGYQLAPEVRQALRRADREGR